MKIKRMGAVAIVFMALLLVAGCSFSGEQNRINLSWSEQENMVEDPAKREKDVYYFGFDRRLEVKEDVRMYVSLLRYLEKETGYKFRLHITPKGGSVVDEFGDGKVHFAAIGTVSFLQAHHKNGVQPLVRGLGEKGESYQAVIITRPDSDIKSVRELKDHSFAFGSPNSTQGHLIPRIMLAQQGLSVTDFRNITYTASHMETANVVMSGQFDAGGVQDILGRTLQARGLVRIIGESTLYPGSVIGVAPGLPPEVVQRVKQALLQLDPMNKDKERLYNWNYSEMPKGFAEAKLADYLVMQQWAVELGLIK